MNKKLISLGLLLVLGGVLWPLLGKFPLGRLPGDIFVRKGNLSFYFPVTTCLLLTVVILFFFWLFRK
ncbi:MAG TPA: DUF2905 domain-containing protein [Proteobacteria bacterium]|nr:DUF2905 domain-containing protein [Pseudomonadota bacterium]